MNIVTIVGPTSTGKSSLAMSLAEKFNGEIVSADSRQVYIGADVGTNKVPLAGEKISSISKEAGLWKVNGVSIHGYDVVTLDTVFSVADFVAFGVERIKDIVARGKVPILVGGTGFFVDALVGRSQYGSVPPNPSLRESLKTCSSSKLLEVLEGLDISFVTTLNKSDRNNTQRLVRYTEIAQAAGSVANGSSFSPLKGISKVHWIGLHAERSILFERADRWIDEILKNGTLKAEVTELVKSGYGDSHVLHGIVYGPVVSAIQKDLDPLTVIDKIQNQLHAYIRRQLTWFKRNKEISWYDVTEHTPVELLATVSKDVWLPNT